MDSVTRGRKNGTRSAAVSPSFKSAAAAAAAAHGRESEELADIGRAVEAAFADAHVSSARSRLNSYRRAKSMPNTPVARVDDQAGTVAATPSGEGGGRWRGGRVDAPKATRLDFLNMIDEERVRETVEEKATATTTTTTTTNGVDETPLVTTNSVDAPEGASSPPGGVTDSVEPITLAEPETSTVSEQKRDESVDKLVFEAAERCATLQVSQTDQDVTGRDEVEEMEIVEETAASRPIPPPAEKAKVEPEVKREPVNQSIDSVTDDFFPKMYRNSQSSSVATLDESDGVPMQQTSTDECVIM